MHLLPYLLGFILFLSILSSGLIWGAVVAGVPGIYIIAASLVIFAAGVGIFKNAGREYRQNPPE